MNTKLYIDGIIYSLQKKGGVSILFNEIINRLPDNYCTIGLEDGLNINFKNQFVQRYKNRLFERLRSSNSNPKCEIFHSTYYRIPKIKHKYNILTVHDFVNEKYNKGFRKSIHSYQKTKAINNADLIICVSNNTKIDLINMYGSSFIEKTNVIYNGVSNDFMPNSNIYSSNQLIFVGNRGGYKNFNSLLIAMEKLINYSLVCVGGGKFNKEELQLIKKFANGRCRHLGYVSNFELNQQFNKSFCLVYPSLYEGFGIPILESMKAGCPVIAVNSSSIPEVTGSSAVLMNYGTTEEIIHSIKILENKETRSMLINLGLKNSNNFSWNKTYQQTFDIYNKI